MGSLLRICYTSESCGGLCISPSCLLSFLHNAYIFVCMYIYNLYIYIYMLSKKKRRHGEGRYEPPHGSEAYQVRNKLPKCHCASSMILSHMHMPLQQFMNPQRVLYPERNMISLQYRSFYIAQTLPLIFLTECLYNRCFNNVSAALFPHTHTPFILLSLYMHSKDQDHSSHTQHTAVGWLESYQISSQKSRLGRAQAPTYAHESLPLNKF